MSNHIVFREPGFRVPAHLWLPVEEVEDGALQQIRNAAMHPDVAKHLHIAVMPDCHVGFGVTIGSVMPTTNAVIPNAVGVDIGCGMCAIETGVRLTHVLDRRFWREWGSRVLKAVPVGFNVHKRSRPLGDLDIQLRARGLQDLLKSKAAFQVGTLGGGNHFLEAQQDERGIVWLMVHSGSRHTGLRIANHYHKLAIEQSRKRNLAAPNDLSSLLLDDHAGQDYLHDMAWAERFALASRDAMLQEMLGAFLNTLPERAEITAPPAERINIHHNFASMEMHGGEEAMVHRKGATQAREGQIGIIPGSMGTNSYIVRGKGSPYSLESCSHGAGRQMGRKAARKAITTAEFAASIEGTHSVASGKYIDEAPGAYKDIDVVIERQRDLVDVVHTLRPIITLKGDSKSADD